MNIKDIIIDNHLSKYFSQGIYGIEKECVRVLEEGDILSSTDHPHTLTDRNAHPFIQTDYGESQPEIVTPPFATITQAIAFLKGVNDVLYRHLPADEYLWPFSIPCHLPDDDEIRIAASSTPDVLEYRTYTGNKYGRSRQLMSGMHINFSFSKDFIQHILEHQEEYKDEDTLKNYLYLKVSRNFLRYQWILVYLFGATPVAEDKFFEQTKTAGDTKPERPMRSIRNSSYGYFNDTDVNVRYDALENYVSDIEESVALKKLKAEREFYGDVRLKGNVGKNIRQLLQSGIEYIELRSLDLNPYSPVGITNEQATFIDLFIMYLTWIEDIDAVEAVAEGMQRSKVTAEEYPLEVSQYKEDGLAFLEGMKEMLEQIDRQKDVALIDKIMNLFENPEKTISGRITKMLSKGHEFIELGHDFGQMYKVDAQKNAFMLKGFYGILSKEHSKIEENIARGKKWEEWRDLVIKE